MIAHPRFSLNDCNSVCPYSLCKVPIQRWVDSGQYRKTVCVVFWIPNQVRNNRLGGLEWQNQIWLIITHPRLVNKHLKGSFRSSLAREGIKG
jgi:hypothetical protein